MDYWLILLQHINQRIFENDIIFNASWLTSAPGYVKKGLDQGTTVDDIDAIANEIQRNIQTVRTQTNFLIGIKE